MMLQDMVTAALPGVLLAKAAYCGNTDWAAYADTEVSTCTALVAQAWTVISSSWAALHVLACN